MARDLGHKLSAWIANGAPAGVAIDFDELDGLYPRVQPGEQDSPEDLHTDYDTFVNYKGVDEDPDAATVIDGYIAKNYLKVFSDLESVKRYVGGDPIVSKLGLVVKDKVNPTTGKITKKVRIILDNKQSGVTKSASRTHRSTLPRATHAIGGALSLMDKQGPKRKRAVRFLIADVSDAFWLIPLSKRERKYFVSKHRGRWLVFMRTAQGSRGAPLSWAAIAALVARCVQSLFFTDDSCTELDAKLQLYVDDPLLAMRGDDHHCKRLCVRFCVAWLVLGFNLAFSKAQCSPDVVWIGVRLKINERRIEATIPAEKIKELLELIASILSRNMIPLKELRTFAGKAMNIASLIVIWRPFLAACWAAMAHTTTNAATNCVWVKQFAWSLLWIQEFLLGTTGSITRIFDYDAYYNRGSMIEVTTDASIYGLGAWITIDGDIISWFAIPVTQTDMDALQRTLGSDESQQACEALVLLVALRLWKHYYRSHRAVLSVRSDNVGALTVVASLKGTGTALGLVARELALDLGDCEYFPQLVSHISGVANTLADVLSRRFDPTKQPWSVPVQLRSIPEASVPERTTKWWRVHSRELTFSAGKPLR